MKWYKKKRGTEGRKGVGVRDCGRRRCDGTSCGGFCCRRNTPANRDPFRSPEQQDYVLRVKAPPHSVHHTRKRTVWERWRWVGSMD